MFTDEEKAILDDIVDKIEDRNISAEEIAIAVAALNKARNEIISEQYRRYVNEQDKKGRYPLVS